MASGKRKRKKADEEDLERAMDDELSALREKMKVAAEMDNQSNNERKPAIAKLKMLHEANALLTLYGLISCDFRKRCLLVYFFFFALVMPRKIAF